MIRASSRARVSTLLALGIMFILAYVGALTFGGAIYAILLLGVTLILWGRLRSHVIGGTAADSHAMGIIYEVLGAVIVCISLLALTVGLLAS